MVVVLNMRIVCISDTHLAHRDTTLPIPDGDLLIHAGDGTLEGSIQETTHFLRWLSDLPHRNKILIAGNHDWLFQMQSLLARSLVPAGISYLEDSAAEIEGLKVYGSPWQPEFLNWAFNLPRGPRLRQRWNQIPAKTDILVTHGPPAGILDQTPNGEHVGCIDLLDAVERLKPKLHVFGHVHHSYGSTDVGCTRYVNASLCDEDYQPTNLPVIVDL
jgi:predicted phosphohydrolase